MYPAESVEAFTERVKNGTRKAVKYHNWFAQLQPINRTTTQDRSPIKAADGLTKTERKDKRLKLLQEIL